MCWLLLSIAEYPTHNPTADGDWMTKMTSSTRSRIAPFSADNTQWDRGLGDMGAAIASSVVRTFPLIAFDLRQKRSTN